MSLENGVTDLKFEFDKTTRILKWPNKKADKEFKLYKYELGKSNVPVKDAIFDVQLSQWPADFMGTDFKGATLKNGVYVVEGVASKENGEIIVLEKLRQGTYTFTITEQKMNNPNYALEKPIKVTLSFTVDANGKISGSPQPVFIGDIPTGLTVTFNKDTGILSWPNKLNTQDPSSGVIEGYVWEDLRLGKTGTVNGVFDKASEKGIKDVKVELWAKSVNGKSLNDTRTEWKCTETKTNGDAYYSFKIEPEYCADPILRVSSLNTHDVNYLKEAVETEFFVKFYYDGLEYTVTTGTEKTEEFNKAKEDATGRQKITNTYSNMGLGEGKNKLSAADRIITATATTNTANNDKMVAYKHANYTTSTLYKCVAKGASAPTKESLASYPNRAYGVTWSGVCHENCGAYNSNTNTYRNCPTTCHDKYSYTYETWTIDQFSRDKANSNKNFRYQHVNLGLMKRDQLELEIMKDIDSVILDINGQRSVFNAGSAVQYGQLANAVENAYDNNTFPAIGENQTEDQFFATENGYELILNNTDIVYDRPILPSDYNYRVDQVPTDKYGVQYPYSAVNGENEKRELEIYVDYTIMLRNNSPRLIAQVTELVDYYSTSLEPIGVFKSKDKDGNPISMIGLSSAGASTQGYNKLYINNIFDELASGQMQRIYVRFKIKKDTATERALILGDKENVVEINRYSTAMNGVTMSGQADRASVPGNYVPAVPAKNGANYNEKDTYAAPVINLRLSNTGESIERKMTGKVWEDDIWANGIRNTGEPFIEGIRVELVEKIGDIEFVWGDGIARKSSDPNKNPITVTKPVVTYDLWGNRINPSQTVTSELVADTYSESDIIENGDNYKLYGFIPGVYEVRFVYGSIGENNNSSYQNGTPQYSKVYGANESKISTKSGCSDTYIQKIIDKAGNFGGVLEALKYTGQDYESTITGANKNAKAIDNPYRRSELNNEFKTINNDDGNLLALTNPNRIAELLAKTWMKAGTENQMIVPANMGNSDMGIGLKERPEFKITLSEEVDQIILRQNDGDILLHAEVEDGVLKPLPVTQLDMQVLKNEISANQIGGKFENVDDIRIILEDYLIGGAQLEVIYKIIASNVGTAKAGEEAVTGNVTQIVDYIDNDLRFSEQTAPGKWTELEDRTLIEPTLKDNLLQKVLAVNKELAASDRAIAPENSETVDIYLSKTLSQDSGESLSYKNAVEILEYSNASGRRNYAGIPGNQDPHVGSPGELDIDLAVVGITPPEGGEGIPYTMYIITVGILAVVGAAVVFTIRNMRRLNDNILS